MRRRRRLVHVAHVGGGFAGDVEREALDHATSRWIPILAAKPGHGHLNVAIFTVQRNLFYAELSLPGMCCRECRRIGTATVSVGRCGHVVCAMAMMPAADGKLFVHRR